VWFGPQKPRVIAAITTRLWSSPKGEIEQGSQNENLEFMDENNDEVNGEKLGTIQLKSDWNQGCLKYSESDICQSLWRLRPESISFLVDIITCLGRGATSIELIS